MALGSGEDAQTPETGRDYLKIVMAVLCLSAVGIAGSTYDSTLESDPDEIIDVKHEWLPIGKDKIQDFKNPERNQAAGGGGGGGGEEEQPCTGGLIGVLASLFPMLIPPCGIFYLLGLLLPILLFLVLVALMVRYRRQLIAPALAIRAWLRDVLGDDGDGEAVTWPAEMPENEVHRAWLAMVELADVEKPWVCSPGECARAAVDDGLDAEPVEAVTKLFEDVRYGGAPVTADRQERAQEGHRRLIEENGNPLADGRDATGLTGRLRLRLDGDGGDGS